MSLRSEAEAERQQILKSLGQDAIPIPPPPAPTPLDELAAQARYKLAAAVAIRRQASAVLNRAGVREGQYRKQLDSLNAALRLIEISVSEPDRHQAEVAELESLAADIALELTTEDEFDGDGDDASADDEDDGEGDGADADDESE